MISSEVQRTLVKSPPELWSELSDPAALARHLGELGEIRIVRVEPEKTVEWAAEHTTGTVSIQASGWGTKVTLSVTRELVAPPSGPADAPQQPAEAESEPDLETAEPVETAAPDDTAEPTEIETTVRMEAVSEEREPPVENAPQPASAETITGASEAASEQAPRMGFFARLFRRRRRSEETAELRLDTSTSTPAPEPGGAFAAVSEALAPEAVGSHAFTDPHAAAAAEPEQSTDLGAELMAAEEVSAGDVAAEDTAVLAAVLDRLGAAHHRPFSRS
jgi:hypothetical protein